MTSQRDDVREDVKFRILRLLQDNPEMSQRALAKEVGVSTGGIHYVLKPFYFNLIHTLQREGSSSTLAG